MQKLQDALKDQDSHFLQLVSHRWDEDVDTKDKDKAAEHLANAMLDAERAAVEWERMKDDERGALQMLIAARNGKMAKAQFERLYGEIRQMGPAKRKREKPHLSPLGQAEVLHYRGFVFTGFDEGKTGLQAIVYVPSDLAEKLPTHQAGYDLSNPDPGEEAGLSALDELEPMLDELTLETKPGTLYRTDTSIIDDITTLLAYVQSTRVMLDETGYLTDKVQHEILQSFIGSTDVARVWFIMFLLVQMGLLSNVNGELKTVRETVKPWLDAPRTSQIRQLVEAWHSSTYYNEIWYVRSIAPEPGSWQNDPRLLRTILQETIQLLATDEWVSLSGLIQELKEAEPDFQRPGGDYTSWYIRDATTGDYLNGFESWDRVEGAMLRFAMLGPMFWLALVDLGAPDPNVPLSTVDAFKLTAFGRAWVRRSPWPDVRDPEGEVIVNPDGIIEASRKISRYDRFQLARFTRWESAGNTYSYRLTSESLRRAAEQGIQVQHVQAFLQRVATTPLPESVLTMLSTTRDDGAASVVLEQLIVLSVDTPEMMQTIWETPEIRRFLSRKIGLQAIAVRTDQWRELLDELQKRGILVDNLMSS